MSIRQFILDSADHIDVPVNSIGNSLSFSTQRDYLMTYANCLKTVHDFGNPEFSDAFDVLHDGLEFENKDGSFLVHSHHFIPEEPASAEPIEKSEYVQGIDDLTAPPAQAGKKKAEYPPPDPKPNPPPSGPLPEPQVVAAAIQNSASWRPAESDWRLFQKWVNDCLSAQQSPSLMNLAQLGWARDPHLVATELMAAMLGSNMISHELQLVIEELTKLCEDSHGRNSVFAFPGPGDDPGPPLITDQKSVPATVQKSKKIRKTEPDLFADLKAEFSKILEEQINE